MDITTAPICTISEIENIYNSNFSCTKTKYDCALSKWHKSYIANEYYFMPNYLSTTDLFVAQMDNDNDNMQIENIEFFILNRDIEIIETIEEFDNRIPIIKSYTLSMIAIEKFSTWFLETQNDNPYLIQKKLDLLFIRLIKNQCPVNFVNICMEHLCELSLGNILYERLCYFLDKAIAVKNIDFAQFFAFKISGLEVTKKDRELLPQMYRDIGFYDNSKFIFQVIKHKLSYKNEILKFMLILIIKIVCNNKFNTPQHTNIIASLKSKVLYTFRILNKHEPNILKSILKHLQIITTIKQSLPKIIIKDKINLCKIVCNSIFKITNNNNIYQIEEKLLQLDEIIPFHTMKMIFQELYRAELADINYYAINDDIDYLISMAQIYTE